ncbi:MAG: STAS domain-containing protein [Cyanobacteria bacterium J06642_3]
MNSTLLSQKVTTFYPQKYLSANNAEQFAQELQAVIETSKRSPLLVNMENVEFIDSAGLMILIEAFRFAKDLDCRMSFCSVAAPVKMVLELTQLDNVFNIFDNQDSFTQSQAA